MLRVCECDDMAHVQFGEYLELEARGPSGG